MRTDNLPSGEEFYALMPQKRGMLMIDGPLAVSDEAVRGKFYLEIGKRKLTAMREDGSIPAIALSEIMAQSIAAALVCRKDGAPMTSGVIAAIRSLEFSCEDSISSGTVIVTEVAEYFCDSDTVIAVVDASSDDGTMLAKGRFTVMNRTELGIGRG